MASWSKFPCITGLILVLGACGEEARISVAATLTPPLAVQMLTVSIRDGDRLIQWTDSDFRPRSGSPVPSTPEVETRTSGPDLELTFRLEDADAVVSTGTVSLPRKSDWRWGVTISAATTDPEEGCFGCFGSQAFPLAEAFRAPERDSVWVVWGGNSIDNPAIY
jgi:hypothetical protein